MHELSPLPRAGSQFASDQFVPMKTAITRPIHVRLSAPCPRNVCSGYQTVLLGVNRFYEEKYPKVFGKGKAGRFCVRAEKSRAGARKSRSPLYACPILSRRCVPTGSVRGKLGANSI